MKVICWLEDVFRTDLPNIQKVQERDLYGRNAETLCVNNPDYRNFFTGLVEDYARSYDIDGIMWGSERQGALSDSLGATHDTPPIDPGNVTCFCQFCEAKAKERGINMARAKQGFLELEKFVRSARSGKRPVDGYYVQFWRLLLRYPELAAWEMLFTDSLRENYAAIYKTVKTAKPTVPVGGTFGITIPSIRSIVRSRIFTSSRIIPTSSRLLCTTTAAASAWRLRGQHRLDPIWRSLETSSHRFELFADGIKERPTIRFPTRAFQLTTSIARRNARWKASLARAL